MKLWTRRLGIFLLVLAVGIVGASTAHRRIAHASTRTLPITEQGAAQHETPRVPPTSHPAISLPVSASPAEVAANPPIPGLAAPVLSAEGPRSSGPELRSAASALAPPVSVRTFHDPNYKVSFDYPANWTFTQKDHEISTFRLDARSATKKTSLRAVAALPANPYPASTFSGGYVYLSVTPHSNASRCTAQATPKGKGKGKPDTSQIGGLAFAHGHDEQKDICTVERDEIYTTLHKGACYRFDLTMNNFCGGEVSGVKDVTQEELETVLSRLESVVQTVRFDSK